MKTNCMSLMRSYAGFENVYTSSQQHDQQTSLVALRADCKRPRSPNNKQRAHRSYRDRPRRFRSPSWTTAVRHRRHRHRLQCSIVVTERRRIDYYIKISQRGIYKRKVVECCTCNFSLIFFYTTSSKIIYCLI